MVVVTGPQAEVDAAKAIIREIVDNDRQVSRFLIYQAPACSTDLSSAGMFY